MRTVAHTLLSILSLALVLGGCNEDESGPNSAGSGAYGGYGGTGAIGGTGGTAGVGGEGGTAGIGGEGGEGGTAGIGGEGGTAGIGGEGGTGAIGGSGGTGGTGGTAGIGGEGGTGAIGGSGGTGGTGGAGGDAGTGGTGGTGEGVCGGTTPHGCYTPVPANTAECPAQIPEQTEGFVVPLPEWVPCGTPGNNCVYTRPQGGQGSCLCDTGVHWLCFY